MKSPKYNGYNKAVASYPLYCILASITAPHNNNTTSPKCCVNLHHVLYAVVSVVAALFVTIEINVGLGTV
jgi:hypothetical protein